MPSFHPCLGCWGAQTSASCPSLEPSSVCGCDRLFLEALVILEVADRAVSLDREGAAHLPLQTKVEAWTPTWSRSRLEGCGGPADPGRRRPLGCSWHSLTLQRSLGFLLLDRSPLTWAQPPQPPPLDRDEVCAGDRGHGQGHLAAARERHPQASAQHHSWCPTGDRGQCPARAGLSEPHPGGAHAKHARHYC